MQLTKLTDIGGRAYSRTVTVAAAASAQQLGVGPFQGIIIASSSNVGTSYLGTKDLQAAPLVAGDEREFSTGNLADWYVLAGTDGDEFYLVGGR